MKSLTIAGLAALAACDAPPSPSAPAPDLAASAHLPDVADPEMQAPPIAAPAPAPMDTAEAYRRNVTGRWSERPACAGMSWNFQAETFTTPGEIHCAAIAVAPGALNALRVTGSACVAEGEPQPDMVLDVVSDGRTIGVMGVGNPVSTQGWLRCE